MNDKVIHNLLTTYNKIMIIGFPSAGKTYLFKYLFKKSKELPEAGHFFLQTDDFKKEPWVQQIYSIMDKLRGEEKWIVEGIQGYRLLRKYIQLHDYEFKPDLIIVVSCSDPTLKQHRGMVKTLTKIWKDYIALEDELPKIKHYHRTIEADVKELEKRFRDVL